ncbi:MAG: helix-turn-helix transcriptional regulator [Actinomycetes bacterium]|jgi:transcriptional regulator with XRE-family HTH domain|nr:helix-turn-helix transcriptional regulator [Actinomycetes bacterium]
MNTPGTDNPTGGKIKHADLGEVLRRARLASGFSSPRVFSKAIKHVTGCDISVQSIYRYEHNLTRPGLEVLQMMLHTLRPTAIERLFEVLSGYGIDLSFIEEQSRLHVQSEVTYPGGFQLQLFDSDTYR